MRFHPAFLGLLLLPLAACDTAEDTGLGNCSFTATTEGSVREDLGGRARYYSGTLDGLAYASVEMTVAAVNGQIADLRLIGTADAPTVEGTLPLNPAGDGLTGWVGSTGGKLSLQSTGGEVRVLHAGEERIEGTFTMDAENEFGEYVLTVTGRFNARTDCPFN